MIEFREINGFPAYRVSNTGVVQSRWKVRTLTVDSWRDIVLCSAHHGYLRVGLGNGSGKWKTVLVHKLVAEAFLGPRPLGHVIRHLSGNPADNSVSNLAYGTYSENERDKILNGTWDTKYTARAKLKIEDVLKIRDLIKRNVKQREISAQFGVSVSAIARISCGDTWSHA